MNVAPLPSPALVPDPGTPAPTPVYGPSWVPAWVRRHAPALALVAFAITYPEFLTGSTPVLSAVVNPVGLLFLLGLYGGGVLLIRDVTIRWGKGWPSVLLLGAAYGILEEGIGTKTFFDPALVGAAGAYGASFGVNWLWATELTVFHAIFSIALPILTVDLLFPATRRERFLTGRVATGVLVAYLVTVALMFALFNRNYALSLVLIIGSFAAALGLVAAARWVPAAIPRLGARNARRSAVAWPVLYGGAFVWLFFAINWIGPALHAPVVLLMALDVALPVAIGLRVAPELSGPDRAAGRWSFLVGCLSFLVVLAGILGVLGDYLVLPVIAALGWLWVRQSRRYRTVDRIPTPPPGITPGA